METTIKTSEGAAIAYINGRVDTVNSNEFEAQLKPLIAQRVMDITLDCADLSYISSSGLRVFLTMLKATKANGAKLTIANMKPEIFAVFEMTGFSMMFTFV